MMKIATIHEVASEAGVSVATVSRVLNHHPSVSLKAKQAVDEAIRKLNYEPNILGRNLRTSSTRMILSLLPSISNPFYSKVLQGIEDTARKSGYYILVCETNSSPEIQSFYLNMAKQHLVDGVISIDPTVEQVLTSSWDGSFPVVQVGESTEDERIPYVGIDNEKAAYKAVKYLIATGHTRIALISSGDRFRYSQVRKSGYEKALKEAHLPVNPEYIIDCQNLDYEDGLQAMKSLLLLENPPTAAFTVADIIAIGAMKAIHEAGLSTPQDIAIVGFDNIPFASMCSPTLTTVAQPMYEMGSQAVQMLISKLTNKKINMKTHILPHELIIRESTLT
jgi:LacI family repressor for deo operon, udp, cdd, tsx, nupC, and nupG